VSIAFDKLPKLLAAALREEGGGGRGRERSTVGARYRGGGSSARVLCFESVPYIYWASVALPGAPNRAQIARENQNPGIKIMVRATSVVKHKYGFKCSKALHSGNATLVKKCKKREEVA
jgi:hypothetical protein